MDKFEAIIGISLAVGTALGGLVVFIFNTLRQNSKDLAANINAEASVQEKVFKQAGDMLDRISKEREAIQKEVLRLKTELVNTIDRHKIEKKELEDRHEKELKKLLSEVETLKDDNARLQRHNSELKQLLKKHNIDY